LPPEGNVLATKVTNPHKKCKNSPKLGVQNKYIWCIRKIANNACGCFKSWGGGWTNDIIEMEGVVILDKILVTGAASSSSMSRLREGKENHTS